MKNSTRAISNSFFESKENEKTSLIFNPGSGLFILFSVCFLFTLCSLLLLFFFGLEVNILPVVVALILTVAVGITIFVLSYVVEMIIELRNNGE